MGYYSDQNWLDFTAQQCQGGSSSCDYILNWPIAMVCIDIWKHHARDSQERASHQLLNVIGVFRKNWSTVHFGGWPNQAKHTTTVAEDFWSDFGPVTWIPMVEWHTLWWTNILPWKDPPFLMGKSTISMAIFNSFLYVHQRVVKTDPSGCIHSGPKCWEPSGHRDPSDQMEDHCCPQCPMAFWDGFFLMFRKLSSQHTTNYDKNHNLFNSF